MKKHLSLIVSLLAVALTAACLSQLMAVQNRLQELESSMNTRFDVLGDRVVGISDSVREELDEQDKLITQSTWDYTSLDVEAKTATVTCQLTPKEYKKGVTKAALVTRDGTLFPLPETADGFGGEVTVPLFTGTEIVSVRLEEGDVVRSEGVYWYWSPYGNLLLNVTAGSWSSSYTLTPVPKNDEAVLKLDADLYISLESYGSPTGSADPITVQVPSARFFTRVNGKEAESFPLSVDDLQDASYAELPLSMNDYKFHIPANSRWDLLAEVIDSKGFRYEVRLGSVTVDANCRKTDENVNHYRDASVYAPDGTLLLSPDLAVG